MSEALPAIGMLTERIELRRRVVTDEAEGGSTALYATLATVWARVRQLGARADMLSDGRGQTITHAVVLRHRNDLRAGDRIAWRGRTLEVLAAADLDGRRVFLSCQCSERVVTG